MVYVQETRLEDRYLVYKNTDFFMSNLKSYTERIQSEPAKRLRILEMKEKLFDGTKYKQGMTGKEIYDKVLGKKSVR